MLTLDQRYDHRGQSVAWGAVGEGAPVVLVHGFPWRAQAWRKIAPWLAARNRVYFFDMLGFGETAMAEGQDVAARAQSDLLAALIGHWGLDRPQVVGHDFGGLAALRAHFVNGVAYSKLHLIDAVAVLPSGSPFYAHVARHEPAFAGLPDYAHVALLKAYIQNAAHRPLSEEAIETYTTQWRGETGQPAFYRQIAHADQRHIAEAQARYAKPDFDVHLLWGAHDSFIPPAQGRELRDRLSATSFTTAPGAGHIIQEDAPEAVVATLLNNL